MQREKIKKQRKMPSERERSQERKRPREKDGKKERKRRPSAPEVLPERGGGERRAPRQRHLPVPLARHLQRSQVLRLQGPLGHLQLGLLARHHPGGGEVGRGEGVRREMGGVESEKGEGGRRRGRVVGKKEK